LTCSSDLSNLGVEYSLLERVNFECCEDINLLNEKWGSILFSQLLRDLSQNSGTIGVFVGFPEKFYSLHLFVFLDQMVGISLEKLLDLQKVVLFGKLNCLIPLVQKDAAIDSLLDLPHFEV